MGILDRLKSAYNAFTPTESAATDSSFFTQPTVQSYGTAFSMNPFRQRSGYANDRSIATSIYTRIAIDGASVQIKHIRLDDQNRYLNEIDSGMNDCLTLEANIDQAARAFRQEIFMTLCEKGVVAIVPVDTTINPSLSGSYDILTMRVGEIIQWYPKHVKVMVYNENSGKRQELTLPKTSVAIVENPLYAVMNEPNSTLQRLIRKLALLDTVDEASASGKLDLIIQLPYVVKTETKRQQAVQRRSELEAQLRDGQYGIAYTDGTEKITQLNRPVENNLLAQIEMLTTKLYGELGITLEVMNGTANEATMLNYWNRTIEPMTASIVEALKRVFLTKTARSQKQTIGYFRDPFALVPVKDLAEIGDKFTRNEIMTANELRQVIGMRPSTDPNADKLRNSNMPLGKAAGDDPSLAVGGGAPPTTEAPEDAAEDNADLNSVLDDMDAQMAEIEKLLAELGVDEDGEDDA